MVKWEFFNHRHDGILRGLMLFNLNFIPSEEGFIMVKLHKIQSNRHNINKVTVGRSLKSIGIT